MVGATGTLLLIMACSVIIGCDRGGPVTTPERTAGAGGSGGESESAPECHRDHHCDRYLRCIEGECAVPPAITGEVTESTPRATFNSPDGEELASFYLELAVSRQEQRRGLMYREEMRDDWGMLFIYPSDRELSFWMRNTLIELDMIFIDGEGVVVGIVERAEPLTETPRSVDGLSRYVLEINGGLAGEVGIQAGSRMKLFDVDPTHQPTAQ